MPKPFTCLALLILCFNLSRAQKASNDQLITRAYTPNTTTIPNPTDTVNYYLVKFNNPPANKALRLIKRVSYNYYIVASTKNITPDKNILSSSPANSLWKADEGLTQLSQKRPKASTLVNLLLKQQNAAVIEQVKNACTITASAGNVLTVRVTLKNLNSLLANPAIAFASLARTAHEELVVNDIDLGANNISAVAGAFPGINGNGINLSVKEQQYDQTDLDLLGRSFTSVTPSDKNSGHATIMATLIGGNGNSFIRGLGSAPAVRFTSSDFARLLPDTAVAFISNNISIQNHSYGTGIENFYGIEAQAYDQQLASNDTLVHVFSSGNIGTTTPSTGLYNGVAHSANLSGTFKQAKNVLVVGGTGRTNIPEALSSSGPAYDGRIKPEIVADGEDGTSGAAALVTGTVALMQQAYKKQFGKLPAAALVKSILITTADDIGTPQVDHKTGYGKLNALEAVRAITDGRFKTGSVANKQQNSYQVTVPPNCRELKVSLAWADVPAALNAPTALVNDLDLVVTTPTNQTLLPWSLSTFPLVDSLLKPAVRSRDSLNNTEQVTLLNPPAGVYTIVIKSYKVTTAVQQFHLSYAMPLANQFEWTFPTAGSQLFASDENYLRWQNTYTAATGTLSVSYDNGATWAKIADVNTADGFYQWIAPQGFTQAQLRMAVNGVNYISKVFTLSAPLSLKVGYNCTTGTLLHWNPQPGATGYVMYSIKDNVLQKLTTATDTSIIIPAQLQSSNYFAVSAQGAGFEGLRSFSIDVTAQGVGCYVRALLADVVSNSIALNLSLGSVLNLKSITWEKLTGTNAYTAFGTTPISQNVLNYTFTDVNPKKGLNYYRTKLTTTDNQLIYSDQASTVILQSNQFTLYPNPVTTQLTILASKQKDLEVKFYDSVGRLSLSKTFNGLQNIIPVTLMPGTYMCAITQNGKVLYATKIVKVL